MDDEKQVVRMTQDEIDFLYFILYNFVGGPVDGPRQNGDSLLKKLGPLVKKRDHQFAAAKTGNHANALDHVNRVLYVYPPDHVFPYDPRRNH